jgi:glucose-1-phosphate thymidylyltransferase
LDGLRDLPIDEIIFITGYLGEQIEQYVRPRSNLPARYLEQTEQRGQAHALHLAHDFIDQPVLIVFADTIVETNLRQLLATSGDGVLCVKAVDDPQRHGVAMLTDGRVTRLVEKPEEPLSNLALAGIYYIRDWQRLRRALHDVLTRGVQTRGEYYLADALQLMIDDGAYLQAWPVEVWEDCGTIEALLRTNRYLLSHGRERLPQQVSHSTIIPPVNIAPTAIIEGSVVGPYVSVADGASIRGTIIRDSIVGERASIANVVLSASLIGSHAVMESAARRVNVGDASEVYGD